MTGSQVPNLRSCQGYSCGSSICSCGPTVCPIMQVRVMGTGGWAHIILLSMSQVHVNSYCQIPMFALTYLCYETLTYTEHPLHLYGPTRGQTSLLGHRRRYSRDVPGCGVSNYWRLRHLVLFWLGFCEDFAIILYISYTACLVLTFHILTLVIKPKPRFLPNQCSVRVMTIILVYGFSLLQCGLNQIVFIQKDTSDECYTGNSRGVV